MLFAAVVVIITITITISTVVSYYSFLFSAILFYFILFWGYLWPIVVHWFWLFGGNWPWLLSLPVRVILLMFFLEQ